MPAIATETFLAANLAALGRRNADLAAKLAGVAPLPGMMWHDTPQGVPAATLDGRQLCSKHRPLDEAEKLVEKIDLVEHAAVVIYGFGLGYHVRSLAERSEKATLLIVFEPDLQLLRAVFERVDHSRWLAHALVLFVSSAQDRGGLARKLEGAESILAQGIEFFEHQPSKPRLGDTTAAFANTFREFIAAARTTLATTLMRSVDTIRNLLLNLDHYAGGCGIAELRNAAAGFPAMVVSAGPSLHKNIHVLAQPGARDRCVIIAVQTVLKPLLERGIKPHFVTALDYHEISRRFYEDIDAELLRDVTLIADPKAHPVILDSYPGPVRCCASGFLDKVLGPLAREMGCLPAGATVAHLAMYVARHLGCNPIAMVGQDLGFPDGLYYAPGAVIHDVWAPELNPFNTIAMMEWQRIARHRLHLHKTRDVHGKSIYTDAQMHTYLQQFERDFSEYARQGATIIDATEGGVPKQHSVPMRLEEFLQRHATRDLPALAPPESKLDAARLRKARQRVLEIRSEILTLRELSNETASLIQQMLDEQHDQPRMNRHFKRIEACRAEVEKRFDAFELVNQLNQLGAYRRMKADRRLHMQRDLTPMQRQRAQLERDLENVKWLVDASDELAQQLARSERTLSGEDRNKTIHDAPSRFATTSSEDRRVESRIAALVPIDPQRNGLGLPRNLAEDFHGRSVLQATLERLGESRTLESIILIAPDGFDVDALIDRARIGLPVEIERVNGSPYGLEHEAISAARLWADTCWRGGIAGMSIYDEVLCPAVMHEIMQRRGMTAALLAGPDWPLIDVTSAGGCDAVVNRHLEQPSQHHLVFTQAPPGMCGCLVSAKLMAELAQRNRLSTVGGLLTYQPHAPQHDPIARDVNVQIDHRVRRSLVRATFDSTRQRRMLSDVPSKKTSTEIVETIEAIDAAPPRHFSLELCTVRISHALFADSIRRMWGTDRPPISLDLVQRTFEDMQSLCDGNCDDLTLTLHGSGDPLLHPQFDDIIRRAHEAGFRGIHVRTELLCDPSTLDRLLASNVQVISVDLNADRAATYLAMMGVDRFRDVLMNIEYLIDHRRQLTSQAGSAALALPWIVPRLARCAESYEDIDTFYDRWQHMLGTAFIDDLPGQTGLTPAVTPRRVIERDARMHAAYRCDGTRI